MSDMRSAIARLTHRLTLAIGRGRITQSDDTGPIQTHQVSINSRETINMRRMAEFGLASWPPLKSDAILVFLTGDRSNGVIVGTHDLASRFKLNAAGETSLFDAFGKYIWLHSGEDGIEINANGTPLVIKNAKGITIDVTDDVTLNMGGKNVVINNPGTVELAGAGGKAIALDQDPVVGGKVQASSAKVTAK